MWNSNPSPDGPLGQVCLTEGTGIERKMVGINATAPVPKEATILPLNDLTGLLAGQYITVENVKGAYKIASMTAAAIIEPGLAKDSKEPGAAVLSRLANTNAQASEDATELPLDDMSQIVPGLKIAIAGVTGCYAVVAVTATMATIDPALAGDDKSGSVVSKSRAV